MTVLSSLPETFSFVFLQGDTLNVEITLVDDNDDPVDLNTFASIESQVRTSSGTLMGDLIVILTKPASGIFEIFLTEDISNSLQIGQVYEYDIQLIGVKMINGSPYTTVATVSKGTMTVEEDITVTAGAIVVAAGTMPKYKLHHRG